MSVRHALLALLTTGPKHGFQLAHDFEAGTGEIWPLNTGQVYTTLQRLERDGFVAADDEPAETTQTAYRITATGRGELDEWLRTPPDLTSPPREELVIKLLVALRIPGVDIADVTQTHRRRLIESMREYTLLKQGAADDDVAVALVADAEIFRLEAMVRWLDAADARIARVSGELPLPLPTSPSARRPVGRRVGTRR
jgi:DNA-binding PadR family transcriptional regulator